MKLLSFIIALSMLICAVPSAGAADDLFIDEPEVDEDEPLNLDKLMSIVAHDDVEGLKPYLAEKFDFNVHDKEGKTPLTQAARCSDKEDILQALLKGGAKVDFPNKNGQTALMLGCYNQEKVNLLLKAGASIHAKDNNGWTMLFRAVWLGNAEFIRYLIGKGLDVNARDKKGKTLLIAMTNSVNNECYQLIIDAGADIHAKDKDGHTAMWHALADCCKEDCQTLLKAGATLEVNNEFARHAMHLLQRVGIENPHLFLMGQNIPIQEPDTDGHTVLRWAAEKGNLAIVKRLLEAKCPVDIPDYYGNTALLNALRKGHEDIALALIKAGANVNHKNEEEENVLYLAIINNNTASFDALLKAGADVNLWFDSDEEATGPLIFAIENESFEIAKKLIAAGVKTDVKNEFGQTALHLVLLCEGATLKDRDELIQMLLDAGVDVNEPDDDGEVPLHLAFNLEPAQAGAEKIIADLLVAGADPNIANRDGITPFMVAAIVGAPPIIFNLMLNKGAKVNEQDADGDTALIMAASSGNEEVVKLLIAAGANVNIRNSDNETALSYAKEAGENATIIKLLKDAGAKD